jgi:hypothetical protein
MALTPRVLTETLAAGGDEAKRAFDAMMGRKKIDVAAIKAARLTLCPTRPENCAGNGALPNGPSYRAHPRLVQRRVGHRRGRNCACCEIDRDPLISLRSIQMSLRFQPFAFHTAKTLRRHRSVEFPQRSPNLGHSPPPRLADNDRILMGAYWTVRAFRQST